MQSAMRAQGGSDRRRGGIPHFAGGMPLKKGRCRKFIAARAMARDLMQPV
jgi:hypothetical protein